jgi:hypothetical protein
MKRIFAVAAIFTLAFDCAQGASMLSERQAPRQGHRYPQGRSLRENRRRGRREHQAGRADTKRCEQGVRKQDDRMGIPCRGGDGKQGSIQQRRDRRLFGNRSTDRADALRQPAAAGLAIRRLVFPDFNSFARRDPGFQF